MAIIKREFPTAGTPSLPTDYDRQNEYIERNAKGGHAVSLTNWDTGTTKPQIAAGSVVEANGILWDVTTDTDIDTSGASTGTIYVYFDDTVPEFKFLDTAPTWSATLNGWYVSGDRFTGHLMTWDGASIFTEKREYSRNTQSGDDIVSTVDGNMDIPTINSLAPTNWSGTYASETIPTVSTWVIPAGMYMMSFRSGGGSTALEIHDGSIWNAGRASNPAGVFVSDGVNYRFNNSSGTTAIVDYRKIW